MVRLKHRYIIAQIIINTNQINQKIITSKDIQLCLRNIIQDLYGDMGLGDFGLNTYIKYFDNRYSNILVIKTNRDAQNKVHFALSCISNIIDITCLIRSLCILSCSRTCIHKLKEIFHFHFQQIEATSETEKLSAIEIINTNIINLEL